MGSACQQGIQRLPNLPKEFREFDYKLTYDDVIRLEEESYRKKFNNQQAVNKVDDFFLSKSIKINLKNNKNNIKNSNNTFNSTNAENNIINSNNIFNINNSNNIIISPEKKEKNKNKVNNSTPILTNTPLGKEFENEKLISIEEDEPSNRKICINLERTKPENNKINKINEIKEIKENTENNNPINTININNTNNTITQPEKILKCSKTVTLGEERIVQLPTLNMKPAPKLIKSKNKFNYDITKYVPDIFALINKVRNNPQNYAKEIENAIKKITTVKEKLIYKGNLKVYLHKGEEIFRQAIDYLNKLEPMQSLIFDKKLMINPPNDIEMDFDPEEVFKKKILAKMKQNRLDGYFMDAIKDPETAILLMIVDDTIKNEGKKREILLDKNLRRIYITYRYYNERFIAYFTFAGTPLSRSMSMAY